MKAALENSRAEIDRIDKELVRLIAERMQAVKTIGAYKGKNHRAPLRDHDRERVVFESWSREAEKHGISSYYVGRVLREILNYSRRMQEGLLDHRANLQGEPVVRVGYQGVVSSYSDLTLTKLFASRGADRLERTGFRTFGAVIDALEKGAVDYAFLPIENTIAGSLNEVYGLLSNKSVKIVDEEHWRVEHCLAVKPGATLEGLRTIRSHPVALQQCQNFLNGLGACASESYFDTAAAAESVAAADDLTVAAICSEDSASRLGLQIIERDIADDPDNITRFLLIGLKSESVDLRQPSKTSLIFTVNHRRGALAECLQIFAARSINLTKLESRPQPGSPWEYLFYVDIEGNVEDENVQQALEEVRTYTNYFRVLGCYPRRREESESVPAESTGTAQPTAPHEVTSEVEDEVPPTVEAEEPVAEPVAEQTATEETVAAEPRERTTVDVSGVHIGAPDRFVVIAGPCAVESRGQIMKGAALVKERGGALLRGGAFKPRSSPYSFQGLGFPGLDLLTEAGRAYELPVVTEVLHSEDVERIAEKADMLQVGARNMQNFALLKRLGTVNCPILLKRGMSATIGELLSAAEYIVAGGNQRVVLCERGIRTFETATRSTLDVSAIPVLRERTSLPIVVDPSHAAGRRDLVIPLALASAAAGADGLIVEVHPRPEEALCDKEQALTADDLELLMKQVRPIVEAQGRTL